MGTPPPPVALFCPIQSHSMHTRARCIHTWYCSGPQSLILRSTLLFTVTARLAKRLILSYCSGTVREHYKKKTLAYQNNLLNADLNSIPITVFKIIFKYFDCFWNIYIFIFFKYFLHKIFYTFYEYSECSVLRIHILRLNRIFWIIINFTSFPSYKLHLYQYIYIRIRYIIFYS